MIKNIANMFPYFAQGKVVKGFGRGSKELGIPTANFPDGVVESLPKEFGTGIYYGWATVDNGPVYKMVMSIGWNPYYNNTKKTMETHVIHTFKDDFYDADMKVCISGYIRPEAKPDSLDELIAWIHNDIKIAKEKLELEEHAILKEDNFFKSSTCCS